MAFQRRLISALWLLSTAPASVLPQAPPIALRVVYPAAEDRVRVRDSSFLLGSVSGPDVRLSINGTRIRVADNGAWLATSRTGQTISALVSAEDSADLAEGVCYNDTGVEVELAADS